MTFKRGTDACLVSMKIPTSVTSYEVLAARLDSVSLKGLSGEMILGQGPGIT